jgi:branched-chain amino acid transport system substrate-binding protein
MSFKSLLTVAALGLSLALPAAAQKKYDPGASDTEIRIGQTMPYSGPASAYATIGRVQAAYFKMVNDSGGINGRKVNFISLDDGFSPPKTVEVVRRLVEQDEVLLLMGMLGAPTNSAIHKYMNTRKVPQLFIADGASKWNDPKNFPWTMGFSPNFQSEGRLYAADILKTRPNAKIAVLYQNDDSGKDYVKGLMDGLGEKAKTMVVAQATYEVTDPTIDSQIITLKGSGADTFVDITGARFAAQAIRKVSDIGWSPTHYLSQGSTSVGMVLQPAGLDKSTGIISMQYMKDPKSYGADPDMVDFFAFMKKYYPDGQVSDGANIYGYSVAQLTAHVLKLCGDNLTRDNIMKQAASLKGMKLPMTLAGVTITTGPDDFALFEKMQLTRFDGNRWVPVGQPVNVK